MSKLIVEVCRVDAVEPHPTADRLAIAVIKGWKTAIIKNEITVQDYKRTINYKEYLKSDCDN